MNTVQEALQEFVRAVDAIGDRNAIEEEIRNNCDWPDLLLAYKQAKRALGQTNKLYGMVGWTIEDVQTIADVDDVKAAEFLNANNEHIRASVAEHGWMVLRNLAVFDGLRMRKEEDEDFDEE